MFKNNITGQQWLWRQQQQQQLVQQKGYQQWNQGDRARQALHPLPLTLAGQPGCKQ